MATSINTVMSKNGNPKYMAAQKPANQVGLGSLNLYPITTWERRFSKNFFSISGSLTALRAGELQ
jgi:hypothetical protein